jgi:phosphate transport system permease protein
MVTPEAPMPNDAPPTPARPRFWLVRWLGAAVALAITIAIAIGRGIRAAADFVIVGVIHVCGWSSILFVAAIFAFVFWQAFVVVGDDYQSLGFWNKINFATFFTSAQWRPEHPSSPEYGILALLVGSIAVTALAMFFAVPLGLAAAVFLSEFCPRRPREVLKVVIELLAAIPSIVWGFIAYVILNPLIINATGAPVGINVLNGGIVLALMSVPIIVSVGEDALRAVPDSFREAGIALGANRWELVYRVLFPAAKNGLLAAVLLGVGRAVGETMAVLMATGHAVQIPKSVLDPARTLTATIAAELGEAARHGDHYRVLFVIGLVLFAIAMIVNLTADLIVKGVKGQQHG